MSNKVTVSTTTNTVTITPQQNTGVSIGTTNTPITVNQGSTSVVQIQAPGVKGNAGPTGPIGPQGPTQDTGSLLTTASYSNPNLTLTKGDGSTFNVGISTTTPTLAQVTSQGSSTTTAITASIISASGDVKAYNFIGQYGTDVLQGSSGVSDSIQFNNRAHWRKSNAYISSRGNEWVLSGNGISEPNNYTEAYVHIAKEGGASKALSLDYSATGNKATFDIDTNGFLEIHPDGLSTHFSGSITASGNISASSTLLGGGLNINGPSNSHVEVGTYNVGFDVLSNPAVETQITGSGLIISGNMADQNHHNFLKIGDIELVDVNTFTTPNQFLIHNAKSFKISSGSDGGDITTQNRLMEHDGANFIIYSGNDAKITVTNTDITLDADNGPSFRAPNGTSATHFNSFFSDPDSTPAAVRSIAKGDMFQVIGGGHVTASAVSSSGTSSFAQISLPDLPTSDPGIAGRLFTTQSTGAGGNLDGQKILLVSAG